MVGARMTPRADDVLRRFFGEAARGTAGRRAARLQAAEDALRACLDEHLLKLFGPQELALLSLERQFDSDDAATRVASAEDVLLLLPLFVDEPRWHGDELEDRRLRLRLTQALVDEIVESPQLHDHDLGRAAWIVEAAVRHEIWMLRQERSVLRGR